MRRWAFIVFIFGMFVLALLFYLPVKKIEDGNLSGNDINERVEVSGEVVSQRVLYGETSLLVLDNGFEILYEGEGLFNGREIRVVGRISEYKSKKQISAEDVFLLE